MEGEGAEVALPAMQPMPIGSLETVDISNAMLHLASDEARDVPNCRRRCTQAQAHAGAGATFASTSSGAPA